jgi:hypothetical protein
MQALLAMFQTWPGHPRTWQPATSTNTDLIDMMVEGTYLLLHCMNLHLVETKKGAPWSTLQKKQYLTF